jgi:hypothetical protein
VLLNAKFLGSYRNGDISNPWTPLEGLMKNTRDESILPAVPSRRLFTGPRPHIASQLSKKGDDIFPARVGRAEIVRRSITVYFFLGPLPEGRLFGFPEHCGALGSPTSRRNYFPRPIVFLAAARRRPDSLMGRVSILTTEAGLFESSAAEVGRLQICQLVENNGCRFSVPLAESFLHWNAAAKLENSLCGG